MLRTRTPVRRPGFTLIELLVVIAIIGVLIALTTAAVQRVRISAQNTQARADIEQLTAAIEDFKNKFRADYPPSLGEVPLNGVPLTRCDPQFQFRLRTSYPATSTDPAKIPDQGSFEFQFLKRLFPRMSEADNGLRLNGQPVDQNTGNLDSNHCLVVFLSGGPFTNFNGFSTNPAQPFAPPTSADEKRMPGTPFFQEFPKRRDQASHYLDPWGTPYMYMAARNEKYIYFPAGTAQASFDIQTNHPCVHQVFIQNFLPSGSAAAGTPGAEAKWAGFRAVYTDTVGNTGRCGIDPLKSPRANQTTQGNFLRPKTFQIISAGPNGVFGRGGDYVPGQATYADNAPGGDDLANTSAFKLSATGQ